jgi:hypothetical protein
MSFTSKLKALDSNYEDAKQEFGDSTGGFDPVPSGNYVVHQVKAEIAESKSSDALLVKMKMKILEGDCEGRMVFNNMSLSSERGPEFIHKWLNVMGKKVNKLSTGLEKALEEISSDEESSYAVSVKTNPDNGMSNVYFNRALDSDASTASTEDAGGHEFDLDSMSLRKLKKLIKDEGLNVNADDIEDIEDLRDAIDAALNETGDEKADESEAEEDEADAKPVARRGKKEEQKSEEDEDEYLDPIKDLCDAFGIRVNEEDGMSEIKKALKNITFKRKDLEKSEITLLENCGLGSKIK